MSLCASADKKHTHAKINTVIRIFILLPFWFLSAKLQNFNIGSIGKGLILDFAFSLFDGSLDDFQYGITVSHGVPLEDCSIEFHRFVLFYRHETVLWNIDVSNDTPLLLITHCWKNHCIAWLIFPLPWFWCSKYLITQVCSSSNKSPYPQSDKSMSR